MPACIVAMIWLGCPAAGWALDSDSDGMPDDWESSHGLNPLLNDASVDSDNDGFTNLQEYLAGTDPWDGGSKLGLNLRKDAEAWALNAGLPRDGRVYRIEASDTLDGGSWQTVGILDGKDPRGLFYDVALPGRKKRFYRLKASVETPVGYQVRDIDAAAYLSAESVTGDVAKRQIDDFVQGAKALGIWNGLSYVPCRSQLGGLMPLGGKAGARWLLRGTASLGTDGVSITNTLAPGGYVNGLDASLDFTAGTQPFTLGSIGWQNSSPGVISNVPMLLGGWQYRAPFMGTYNGSGLNVGNGLFVRGLNVPSAYLVTDSERPIVSTYRRPFMMAMRYAASSQVEWLMNNTYGSTPTSTVPAAPSSAMAWVPPAPDGQSGVVSGAWTYEEPLKPEVWRRMWSLVNSTLLSDTRPQGFLYWTLGGQSNSSSQLALDLEAYAFCGDSQKCTLGSWHSFGGQPITYWVGEDPMAMTRQAAYCTGFFSPDGQGVFQRSRPVVGIGNWTPLVVWMQGETDTETYDNASRYKSRLKQLISWIREDLGRSDCRFILGKIDYSAPVRQHAALTTPDPGQGNTSRTQRIEMIRTAIQEIADEDPWIDVADSRGCERSSDTWNGVGDPWNRDSVHLTTAGNLTFSQRILQAAQRLNLSN